MEKLSYQQHRVYFLLFTELSMKEIAARLEIHPTTLDTHAAIIYRKFGVSGRIGLILRILQETKGQIPVDSGRGGMLSYLRTAPGPHSDVR